MSDAKEKKGDAKAEGEAAAPAKAGGGNKLLAILVGVNSLLLVGVMAFLVLQLRQTQHLAVAADEHVGKASEEKKAEKAEKPEAKEEKSEEKPGEKGEGKEEGARGAEGSSKGGPLVRIPDFVVHLRNPDADRYARVSFEVEVYGESDKDRLNAASARVRDAFIGYLSDRTLEDLRGSEGLSRTKDALQTTLRQLLPDVRIRALYISDFVVQ
jgi:flagellar protein FliL